MGMGHTKERWFWLLGRGGVLFIVDSARRRLIDSVSKVPGREKIPNDNQLVFAIPGAERKRASH